MKSLIQWVVLVSFLILLAFFQPAQANTPEWIVGKTHGKIDYQTALKIVSAVNQYTFESELDPDIVFKIITIESNFDPGARSNKNARGLMQVVPKFHRQRYKGENIHDIETNIRVGVEILVEYKSSDKCHGDTTCALRRYYGDTTSNRYPRLVNSIHLPPVPSIIADPPPIDQTLAVYLNHELALEH